MKKNVIALAVAAAMAAPLAAQAEVKITGQLQAEVASLSGDNVTEGLYVTDAQEAGNPGSGNFGALNVSASEDLGNGMKAIAKYGMNISVDGRAITQRDAYVGLSGGFGTVLVGTMTNPYKGSTVKWDPFLATSAQARGNNGMSTLHNGYTGNAVAYANKFGMAKVVAAIVIDDAADDAATASGNDTSGDHAFSLSVNVPVGPVELALAYIDTSDLGTAAGSSTDYVNVTGLGATPVLTTTTPSGETGDSSAMKVGVKYAAGAMGVAFQIESVEVGTATQDWMYLNGTYTAGANTFAAAYGQSEWDTAGAATPTYMSLGMVHSFSKSTSAHVAYVAMDTDTTAGDDAGIAAGLRVKF